MKKISTLILAIIIAISLVACDKDDVTNNNQQNSTQNTQNSSLPDAPKGKIAEAEGKSVQDSSKEKTGEQSTEDPQQIDQGDVWKIREKYIGNYKYTDDYGQDAYLSISMYGNDGLQFNDNRMYGNLNDFIPWDEIEDDDSVTYTNDSGCLFTFTWSDDGESLQYSIYESGVKETTRDVTAVKARNLQ